MLLLLLLWLLWLLLLLWLLWLLWLLLLLLLLLLCMLLLLLLLIAFAVGFFRMIQLFVKLRKGLERCGVGQLTEARHVQIRHIDLRQTQRGQLFLNQQTRRGTWTVAKAMEVRVAKPVALR